MSRARAIIEELTGPSAAEVAEILAVITSSGSWMEANPKLKPYGVVFTDDPRLTRVNALGGYDTDTGLVLLNCYAFSQRDKLQATLEHELTHRNQMGRAAERGGNTIEIGKRKEKNYLKNYARDPLEMQALAHGAVASAGRQGQDARALLRQGQLDRYSLQPPGDRKRFSKYAYQMTGQ